jgi:hypothetical protein
LSITKKAISIGLSGAMLASLAATVVAPAALAAVTVGSVGVVPVGGSSTANNLQLTFTEQAINSIPTNSAGSFTVAICDSAGFATYPACTDAGAVSFIGTPSTAASTGSLGASASIAGNVLTVSIAGSDPSQIESVIVSGLGISATTAAATGAIQMQMDKGTGAAFATPHFAPVVFQAGGTATGTIAAGIGIGATSVVVNVTSGSCTFVQTTGSAGTLDFATSPESVNITGAPTTGPGVGQQTLPIAATANVHNAAELVSQSDACAPNGVLASPGTVANGLLLSSNVVQVVPGESNQVSGTVTASETAAGTLGTATPDTITLAITTAGVQFSSIPAVGGTVGTGVGYLNGLTFSAGAMNAARTSITWTVTHVSATNPGTFTITPYYDLASTVTNGTNISVTLTTTAGPVSPTSTVNAQVGRIFTATAGSVPNVYIGQNGQKTGLITVKEVAAGSFTAGAGPINQLTLCLNESDVTWYTGVPPYAEVVGGTAAGNLILRDGNAASTTNIVAGTLTSNSCYTWTVWTASTTASTIIIGGDNTFTFGPYVSLSQYTVPGPLNAKLYADSSANPLYGPNVTVQIANKIFQNSVVVTALSQPYVAPGSGDALVGSLQISETAMGQLKPYEHICVVVLPRSTNGLRTQDTLINWLTTANVPVATASNGVTIDSVNLDSSCVYQSQVGGPSQPNTIFPYLPLPTGYTNAFSFNITQQSTTGNGMVTINNIHYSVTADAPKGPVQVEVFGFGAGNTQVQFDSTVSNAIVGTVQPTFLDASSATGVTTTNSAFSLSTKVVKKGSYVTVMIKTTPALGGAHVGIYIAKKGPNGVWSKFSPHTGRIANGSGVVYYYYKAGSVAWLSIRGYFTGSGTQAAAWSNAVQVKFTK